MEIITVRFSNTYRLNAIKAKLETYKKMEKYYRDLQDLIIQEMIKEFSNV